VEYFRTDETFRAALKAGARGAKSFGKSGAKLGGKLTKSARKGKKSAIKLGKKAKSSKAGQKIATGAKKGASKAKAFAKSPAGKKAAKYAAAATVLGGGAMYLNRKMADKNEAVKSCVQVCLPEGYDEVVYGGKAKSTMQYRTLESVKAKGADVDADQPFCTDGVEDCGSFCEKKCDEANPLDIPGSALISGAVDVAGDTAKGAANFLGKGAGFLGKGIWTMIKWPVIICCSFLCLALVFYLMMMMPKSRGASAPTMPAPPARYY